MSAFGGANAAGARRGEARLSKSNVPSSDLAAVPRFSPRSQVHLRHRAARDSRIQKIARQIERRPLHVVLIVHVLAHNLGQGGFTNLGELVLGEADIRVVGLVPESIAFPRLPELYRDYTSERGPHQSTLKRPLAHPAWEQVDVVHGSVDAFHPSYHLWRHLPRQIFESGRSFQIAQSPVIVVRGYTVISGTMNVKSNQVDSRIRYSADLEQMIGHLTGYKLIQSLHRGGDQSSRHFVHHVRLIEHIRVEETVSEQDGRFHVLIVAIHSRQMRPQQRVTDPVRRRSEFGEHARVAGGRIFFVVALRQQFQSVESDSVPAEYPGQEFIVRDML